MTDWPSTLPLPDEGLEEQFYKPQVRTEFEGNYVQSRPKATRGRSKWPLAWHSMEESDYQDLLAFFAANQGGSFDWTHPVSTVEYECRFSEDFLTSKIASTGKRKDVKCPIEEV